MADILPITNGEAGSSVRTKLNGTIVKANAALPVDGDGSQLTGVNAATLGGEAGAYYLNRNNHTGTVNPSDLPTSSDSQAGIVELTAKAETLSGNDLTRALTVSQLQRYIERVQFLTLSTDSWNFTPSTGSAAISTLNGLSISTGATAGGAPTIYKSIRSTGTAGTRIDFRDRVMLSGSFLVRATTANGSFQLYLQDSTLTPPSLVSRGFGLRIDGTNLKVASYVTSETTAAIGTVAAGDMVYYTLSSKAGTLAYHVTINGADYSGNLAGNSLDAGFTEPRLWLAAQNNADAAAHSFIIYQPKLLIDLD